MLLYEVASSNPQPQTHSRNTLVMRPVLVTADVHDDVALVRASAVFPQVNTLPRTERQTPFGDGYHFTGLGQSRARVGWHVVRPFVIVLPAPGLGREVAEPAFQITQDRRIGVFLNHQAGRRVLHEYGAETCLDAARGNDLAESFSDVGEALAA